MKLKTQIILLLILSACGSKYSKTQGSSSITEAQNSTIHIIEETDATINKHSEEFLKIEKIEENIDQLGIDTITKDTIASLKAPQWLKDIISDVFNANEKLEETNNYLTEEIAEITSQNEILRNEINTSIAQL